MVNPNQAPLTTERRFLYVTPFIARTDGILAAPHLINPGSGYTQPFVSGTLTGGGTGGNVVLNINTSSSQAEGVFIASRGSNYVNPTVTFPTPVSGSPATAILYANQSQSILGNPQEEDGLLAFCQAQNINALILYELNFMDWNNNGQGTVTSPGRAMLRDFIIKANTYGVDHISAARGWNTYQGGKDQVNQIKDYNLWCQTISQTQEGAFNSITTEVEWWQANPDADKFLVEAVLGYANQQLRNPNTTQLDTPIEINVYLGKGPNYSSTDPAMYASNVDRWLIATYVNTANTGDDFGLYSYTRGDNNLHRLLDIAEAYKNIGGQAKVLPIFSAESKLNPWNRNGGFNGINYNIVDPNSSEDFMGVKLSNATPGIFSLQKAYENWARQVNAGYPVNSVWETESDPTIYSYTFPEGIAVFESRLLTLSGPREQTQPTPPYIPQGGGDAALLLNSKRRKPTPKTQREISIGLQEPYPLANLGNPNDGTEVTRASRTSFRNDDTKPFVLGISDVDESIKYYIDNIIKPSVLQNGERLAIPVIYGNPEKWKAVQKDGYYRDKNGALMCPLIMFKRDSIEKVRNIGNKVDANLPHLYGSMAKKYTDKNAYSNFEILNNRTPIKQTYLTVIPDYVTITYSCTIMTYYMEQLNKVVEAMNYASDSYWGDPNRFKFQARINSFNIISEAQLNRERVLKSTFNIKLYGYLVPDTIQKELIALKKVNSRAQILITTETTNTL